MMHIIRPMNIYALSFTQGYAQNRFPHVNYCGQQKRLWIVWKTRPLNPQGFRQAEPRAHQDFGAIINESTGPTTTTTTCVLMKKRKAP